MDRMLLGELDPTLAPRPESNDEDQGSIEAPPFLQPKLDGPTPFAQTPFPVCPFSSEYWMQGATRPQETRSVIHESIPSFGELVQSVIDAQAGRSTIAGHGLRDQTLILKHDPGLVSENKW